MNNPRIDGDGTVTWDCIYFGSYWQNDTNGDGKADQNDEKQPIKWRVLSVDGEDAFLLADRNLDCQPYNDTLSSVTWKTCTLRLWLNDDFFQKAFTSREQLAIKTTTVVNHGNEYYGTEGGADTKDKVYLLSDEEVRNPAFGFSTTLDRTSAREARNTAYAKEQGAYTYNFMGNGDWWLRSPGFCRDDASLVSSSGSVDRFGYGVNDNVEAARPALHLNLSSITNWSQAGTVSSDGTESSYVPSASAVPSPSASVSENTDGIDNPRIDSDGTVTWDCIYFGSYWQNDTNRDGKADQNDEKQPIKWRVLSVNGEDAFLLADQNLDCQPYNDTLSSVTWETCKLRQWLNGNFFQKAFTAEEQSAIKATTVVNHDNEDYGTEGGADTEDNVYLLSYEEVRNPAYGFPYLYPEKDSPTREAKNTAYARKAYMGNRGTGYWWLRSPGNRYDASYVSDGGYVSWSGSRVNSNYLAVRPALHLNLSSDMEWSQAGTVSAKGGETMLVSPVPTDTELPASSPGAEYGCRNPRTGSDGVTTWDCIYFGNYWQNDTNSDGTADQNDEKEPIKWRVLSVDGQDAFLLAVQNLDHKKYNETHTNVTWETCTLRQWLNDVFWGEAFTEQEQSAVRTTRVTNRNNPWNGTEGGADTSDHVYLLSLDEVRNPDFGFPTTLNNTSAREAGNGAWWLRSPGIYSNCAASVCSFGDVDQRGNSVASNDLAIRPALHLNLSSVTNWSHAGTVSSDGTESPYVPSVSESPVPVETASPIPTDVPDTQEPVESDKPMGTPSVPDASESPVPVETASPIPTDMPGTQKPVESDKPTETPSVSESAYGISNPKIDIDGTTTWDSIYFGYYWQNDTNGDGVVNKSDAEHPIKWRVLSMNGDDVFLLADQNLDCRKYNEMVMDVTWRTCTLRQWLNFDFFQNAFDSSEQSAILADEYGDKVELLSDVDASNSTFGFRGGFYTESETRKAKNTEYAKARGAYSTWWWLRTQGDNECKALAVDDDGCFNSHGTGVDDDNVAVRPTLHLNLASDKWGKAGTISSSGVVTGDGTVAPTARPVPNATPDIKEDTTPSPKPTVTPLGDAETTSTPAFTATPNVEGNATPSPKPTVTPLGDAETTSTPAFTATPNVEGNATPSPKSTVTPIAERKLTLNVENKTAITAPAKVKIKKTKNKGSRKLFLSWKKIRGANGYQIQYTTAKKFKKKKNKFTKKTKYTIKKLNRRKTYYIRVRAYKLVKKKKVYGKWSKIKKVKIKR